MSDAGGAGGRNPGGAGGEAGQAPGAGGDAPAPACAADGDCDDGKACDGAEHCNAGECEAGEAFSCPPPSACFEAEENAACRYAASDRFAVYNGNDFGGTRGNAVAVSISRLAQPTRLNWSEDLLPANVSDDERVGGGPFFWSPDGKRLVYGTFATDFGLVFEQKLYWLDLTSGIEGQPRRLENVPVKMSSNYEVKAWSADFNALLLVDVPSLGPRTTLAVRFNATGVEIANIPASGVPALCDDDSTLAYAAEDGTHIVSAWAAKGAETILPATLLSGSPDGRWLLLSDDAHAYLAPCKLGTKPEMLGGPGVVASGWSSDSKYLAYADGDEAPAALSAWEAASQAVHHAIFEAVVADPRLSFEPGSDRALYTEQTAKDERVWHVEDFAHSPSNVRLPIPDHENIFDVAWVNTASRIRYVDGSDLYVVAATTAAKPQLAFHSRDENFDTRYSNDGSSAIWFETGAGLGALTQLYALDLAHDAAKPQALFHAGMTGDFSFDDVDATFFIRAISAPREEQQLFIVPDDFASEPTHINSGTFVDWPSLQPRR